MFLEKSIGEKSDHAETYFYLGECFNAKGQIENAIDCFEKASLYDCNNKLAVKRRDDLVDILENESPKKKTSRPLIDEEKKTITLDDIRKGKSSLFLLNFIKYYQSSNILTQREVISL